MDLNHMLVWLVLASCGVGLFGLIRGGAAGHRMWFIAFGLVIGTTVGLLRTHPAIAGYAAGVLWLLLVVTPLLGYRAVQQYLTEQAYGRAARLTWGLQAVHPSRTYRSQARLWEALGLVQAGRAEQGLRRLEQLSKLDTPESGQAICHYLRLQGRWRELAAWQEQHYGLMELAARPDMMLLYLRALGEAGELSKMLSVYRHVHTITATPGLAYVRQFAQVFVSAFCGRADLAPRFFEQELAGYPVTGQRFWLATALLAGGANRTANKMLQELHEQADPMWRGAIEQRLSHPLTRPSDRLQGFDWEVLRELEDEVEAEAAPHAATMPRRMGVVETLICINLVVYVMEIFLGGSTNEFTLLRMGALVSSLVVEGGEYWRIVAAMFLHWGPLHIIFNMLGLYIFGPYVAAVLGNLRFLVVYFGAGIGSMGLIVLVNTITQEPEMVVGASGCIMGLVGATGAIFWRLWRRERSREARERLFLVLAIVGIQTIFDITTPQVSWLAHFSGAAIGLLLTSLLRHEHANIPE